MLISLKVARPATITPILQLESHAMSSQKILQFEINGFGPFPEKTSILLLVPSSAVFILMSQTSGLT
jgi:hypothetical protein